MKRSMLVLLAPLTCMLGQLAACSGDDDAGPPTSAVPGDAPASDAARKDDPDEETARAIEVVTSDLTAHPRADPKSPRDVRCVAEVVVDALGVIRIEKLGLDLASGEAPELTVPPMTESEGDLVYGAYDRCLDTTARDVDNFMAAGLSRSEARCASDRYRASPIPRTHLLLRNHDDVPHADLHAKVEALWEGAQTQCRS